MSLPSLLLVDDSDAILALERAILSGHYTIHTASNGREALEKVGRLRPAAVLLDLSMPEMDGDEVLQRMKADPATADIPVIIISSEKSRAEACLGLGAETFLAKPFRADELLETVGEAMTSARQRARTGSLLVLRVTVGELEFAIPLDAVREVLLHPATRPLPTGPAYLREYVEVRGAALCVLDVARRLGVEHKLTRVERMLVVIEAEGVSLALAVDTVKDPEEYAAAERHLAQAAALYRAADERGGEARCIGALAEVALARRDLDGAWTGVQEAIALLVAGGDEANAAWLRIGAARLLVLRGEVLPPTVIKVAASFFVERMDKKPALQVTGLCHAFERFEVLAGILFSPGRTSGCERLQA